MAERSFETLLPRISPNVPGCPQALILQTIRDAAVRMCEQTLAWRHVEPKFDLQPGVSEYNYRKPINTEVHAVFQTTVNDYPLDRLTLEQALELYPQWVDLYSGLTADEVWQNAPPGGYNTNTFNGELLNGNTDAVKIPEAALEDASEPRAMCQITPDKYVVLPLPDDEKPYTIRMFYALKPKRNAEGMEDAILNELEDIIFHSTLEKLLIMPDVSWGDRELASYHARRAVSYAMERRARANLGNQRASASVQLRPWA